MEYKGYRIEIEHDEFASNPRTDFDNFGKMYCLHGRYDLGDKHSFRDNDFESWKEFMEAVKESDSDVFLPLYLYDHSGITISTSKAYVRAFDPQGWDSGMVGFIHAPASIIRKEYNVKRITKRVIDIATKLLQAEVDIYDQYLTGDVWSIALYDENNECVDSCGGFYGSEYAEESALDMVKAVRCQ